MRFWKRLLDFRQPPVFNGEIGRMLVVGAPAGAGKSTFLKSLKPQQTPGVLPDYLSFASKIAASHLHMFQLVKQRAKRLDEVVIHCDILAPVLAGLQPPYNHDELLGQTSFEQYKNHKFLNLYFTKPAELHIIILYVRRAKNLERWLCRESQAKKASARYDSVSWALEDRTNDSEHHRAMYRAWLQFCQSTNPRSITVIDANSDHTYRLMQIEDFNRELDEGY